jgi:hypothetical protein
MDPSSPKKGNTHMEIHKMKAMKSPIRAVLAAGLAMLAFSALATASASAEAVKCPGKNEKGAYILCSGGVTQIGTFAFTGVHDKESPIYFEVPSFPMKMYCEGGKITKGSFDGTEAKLELTGLYIEMTCEEPLEGSTICEVLPVLIDGAEGKGTGPGLSSTITSSSELRLTSTSSEQLWTHINIKSKPGHTCQLASASPGLLRGEQGCKLLEGATEESTHVLECNPVSSNLKLFGKETHFQYGAELTLTSGKDWSIQKL